PAAAAGAAGWSAAGPRPARGGPPGAAAARPARPPRSGRRPARSAGPHRGSARGGAAFRSRRRLLAPEDANGVHLPRHRAAGAAELVGDLVVAVAFHLPDGHLAERVVAEQLEQPPVLVAHLGGEVGRRLVADDLDQGRLVLRPYRGHPRRAGRGATAALQAVVVSELAEGLVGGDDDEQNAGAGGPAPRGRVRVHRRGGTLHP